MICSPLTCIYLFHLISFHIFKEGGPSVITDIQGALFKLVVTFIVEVFH